MKTRKGFTLIELMAVIMVIAILIGIALPRFRGIQEEALYTKAEGELRTLQAAVESYYIHSDQPQHYPESSFGIVSDTLANQVPLVVNEPLYDPFYYEDSQEYNYMVSEGGAFYVIFSIGPDFAYDIAGINNDGDLEGSLGDDIFVTNGSGEIE